VQGFPDLNVAHHLDGWLTILRHFCEQANVIAATSRDVTVITRETGGEMTLLVGIEKGRKEVAGGQLGTVNARRRANRP
jgi:hypothetical protein